MIILTFLNQVHVILFFLNLMLSDYKGWARGLKKAGYATNPDYANMLIRKIEENNLMAFDLGRKYVNPDCKYLQILSNSGSCRIRF